MLVEKSWVLVKETIEHSEFEWLQQLGVSVDDHPFGDIEINSKRIQDMLLFIKTYTDNQEIVLKLRYGDDLFDLTRPK
jgi:hypothetical protein